MSAVDMPHNLCLAHGPVILPALWCTLHPAGLSVALSRANTRFWCGSGVAVNVVLGFVLSSLVFASYWAHLGE